MFNNYLEAIEQASLIRPSGRITAIHGLMLEAKGCQVSFGEIVEISQLGKPGHIKAEVVGLKEDHFLLMPFAEVDGLNLDSLVVPTGGPLNLPISEKLLGRVINPLGEPLDELGEVGVSDYANTKATPINPMGREKISTALPTGVRVIDLFAPVGLGQRIGIFAGSGVGKSTLLGMISRYSDCDIAVVALVGERGREVGDFIRDCLGEEGMAKVVLVVASASDPAVLRRQAAYTATTIAEWFRHQDKDVLLIMDSVTRFAMAQREIGMSVGESLGSRGYPPSVFSLLPPLLERCGNFKDSGSITAIYTVLVEGDDHNEPISDHLRATLDGHITLSRELSVKGHYPSVDVNHSLSRLAGNLYDEAQAVSTQRIRKLLADYQESKTLIEMGLYKNGSNADIDLAIQYKPKIDALLTQNSLENVEVESAWRDIHRLSDEVR